MLDREVRIGDVVMPNNKCVLHALSRIYGVGVPTARTICKRYGISVYKKICDLSNEELSNIISFISTIEIEGDLRRDINAKIDRLIDIKCYRGYRHRKGLPVRGQRTRRNSRTARKVKHGKVST